ncbi:MAG: hypothetical protein JWO91_2674 [Acidobacteriaceae bacterium]|nr:hypothetical protein [Acidobacteriaceae bacterium]
MAAILGVRKLSNLDGLPNSPRLQVTIYDSIMMAEKILKRIDDMFPVRNAR